jgi:dTDP-4-dehydrorhamnose reductase
MRILVTGGRGQLGQCIARRGIAQGHVVVALGRDELDIGDPDAVARALDRPPDLVINAAAYTAVDRAESDRDRAFAVNAGGAANVARACAQRRVPLVHVSTDHVFDGRAVRPYREDDPIAPVNVYGASKAEGERAVRESGATIVRTSWLVSSFAAKIVELATEHATVQVVDDQHGCPTIPDDLADALIALRDVAPSTYHFCNAGPTSRHGLAVAIVEAARRTRVLRCEHVEPITTADAPSTARRPAYVVLDTTRVRAAGIATPPWRDRIGEVV